MVVIGYYQIKIGNVQVDLAREQVELAKQSNESPDSATERVLNELRELRITLQSTHPPEQMQSASGQSSTPTKGQTIRKSPPMKISPKRGRYRGNK
jgi:hypothetical protein